eukprot:3502083-Pyramimonas_sp.AAC.1
MVVNSPPSAGDSPTGMDRIIFASSVICNHAVSKIADGDVVLTYAHSEVVKDSLIAAHKKGISFRVVVVNSRPKNEGTPRGPAKPF